MRLAITGQETITVEKPGIYEISRKPTKATSRRLGPAETVLSKNGKELGVLFWDDLGKGIGEHHLRIIVHHPSLSRPKDRGKITLRDSHSVQGSFLSRAGITRRFRNESLPSGSYSLRLGPYCELSLSYSES